MWDQNTHEDKKETKIDWKCGENMVRDKDSMLSEGQLISFQMVFYKIKS